MDNRFDEMVDLIRERVLLKNLVEVNPSYSVILMPRIEEIKNLINGVYATTEPSPKDAFSLITMQLAAKINMTAMDHMKDTLGLKDDPSEE